MDNLNNLNRIDFDESEFKPADYLLAGRAKFTVQSSATSNHLTFKISKCRTPVIDNKQVFFVSVNSGYEEYRFIGTIFANEDYSGLYFKAGKKLNINDLPVSFKVMQYIVKHYLKPEPSKDDIIFFHHGCCARCGRTLTTPSSIKLGLGPYCASRIF